MTSQHDSMTSPSIDLERVSLFRVHNAPQRAGGEGGRVKEPPPLARNKQNNTDVRSY